MDEWTKNSGKGAVIMQIMKKMGYVQGKGLGAKKQGIIEPVSAKVQCGRNALGYQQDEQFKVESKFRAVILVYSQEDEQFPGTMVDHDNIGRSSAKQTWKMSTVNEEKIRHKTLEDMSDDDVIFEGKLRRLNTGFKMYREIIDLTGPNEKIYEDFASYYEHANSREGIGQDTVRNTSKMIDVLEKEIRRNGRELQSLKDQTYGLKEDRNNLVKEISLARAEVMRMEEMIRNIERSLPVLAVDSSALEECRVLFMLLKKYFPIEFKLFGMDALMIANILPIIKSSFTRWMPGDISAIKAILPWKNVFTPIIINEFLILNIIPKLERALQTINIHTTEKFICLGIFEWTELVGSDIMCDMIVQHFFPRFYANICSKLSSPNAMISSVKEYYAEWKNLFPKHFFETKPFRDEFTRALMAINQVQSGSILTPVSLPKSFIKTPGGHSHSAKNYLLGHN